MKVPPEDGERARIYRATLSGDGMPGPIEERIGRKLLRLVPADSTEGRNLLDSARVELIGPDSRSMGKVHLRDAVRKLRERLERRLEDPDLEAERPALREGMSRLIDRTRPDRDH